MGERVVRKIGLDAAGGEKCELPNTGIHVADRHSSGKETGVIV